MSSVSNNNTSLVSQQSSVLSENVQQEMMQNWNPVLPPTFHIYQTAHLTSKKRKRVIIEDESR